MKIKTLILSMMIMSIGLSTNAQSNKKVRSLISDNKEAKKEFLETDFEMEKHFKSAYAYALFPNVGKGAIGVGGAAGTGIAYVGGEVVGVVKMTQISIGFQWGGQAYRELIFFEDKASFDRFRNNNVKLAAQASAVAATLGASADAKYDDGIMIFTMQKGGLMYEASIGGQRFKFKPYPLK